MSRTMLAISIFQASESSGGQFQNRNDRLPKPRGGLHCHSVMRHFFRHFGHGTRAGPEPSIHSAMAFPKESPSASPNGSISAAHEGQTNPSQADPSAHSLNPLPTCGSTPHVGFALKVTQDAFLPQKSMPCLKSSHPGPKVTSSVGLAPEAVLR